MIPTAAVHVVDAMRGYEGRKNLYMHVQPMYIVRWSRSILLVGKIVYNNATHVKKKK